MLQSTQLALFSLKGRFDDLVERRKQGERGAMAVEYALIAALMAAIILAAVVILNSGLRSAFIDIRNSLQEAIS